MDRQTAWERLDAVRADSDDLAAPELIELAGELQRDETLRREFDRRLAWDRGIAVAMHDVAVPPGLKSRLIVRLAEAESAPIRPAHAGRRKLLAALATVAATIVVGVVSWSMVDRSEPVTLAEARHAAELLLAQPKPSTFHGSFTPALPDSSWSSRLRIHEPVFGELEQEGRHRAAAWHVSSKGRATWQAIIVAVPADRFISPPAADSISDRDYVPGGQLKNVQTVRWTQNGFVYVCCVDGLDSLIAELEHADFV